MCCFKWLRIWLGRYLYWSFSRFGPWTSLFLVYIKDLIDNIYSNMRLFADDSSLFAIVRIVRSSQETHGKILNDLLTIAAWSHQWKRQFSPDIPKRAIEVVFSHITNKPDHPLLVFNGIHVTREKSKLSIYDSCLSTAHWRSSTKKAKKGVGLLNYYLLTRIFPPLDNQIKERAGDLNPNLPLTINFFYEILNNN